MLNLEDLSQLVAFYKYGTLTKVAEEFHISQPTITRTMKRVEDSFGVSLFNRSANRIALNEVGIKAARYAEELLEEAEQCCSKVLAFENKINALNIFSCAPAPLWDLLPTLARKYPGKTITSKIIAEEEEIVHALREKNCNVAILTYPFEEEGFTCKKFKEEYLYLNVPKNHALANYKEVSADMINGYNCLLSPEIGFWEKFCKTKLPNSRFLVQEDEFAFLEIIKQSSLPCFTTNLALDNFTGLKNRIDIPITDEDAHATFYIVQPRK